MKSRKIGSVARELNLSERRIREYERAGLVRFPREPNTGDRLFDKRAVAQIRIIKELIHQRGFTMQALRQLIRYAPCWELADCDPVDSCAAVRNPRTPCYEQRASGVPLPGEAGCERCLIYRSKDLPRQRLAISPRDGADAP